MLGIFVSNWTLTALHGSCAASGAFWPRESEAAWPLCCNLPATSVLLPSNHGAMSRIDVSNDMIPWFCRLRWPTLGPAQFCRRKCDLLRPSRWPTCNGCHSPSKGLLSSASIIALGSPCNPTAIQSVCHMIGRSHPSITNLAAWWTKVESFEGLWVLRWIRRWRACEFKH